MSSVGKQRLTVFQSANGWRGVGSTIPHSLHLISDNLNYGVQYRKNENHIKDTRSELAEAIILDPQKPEGQFTYEPRPDSLKHVLYSHFQKVYQQTFELNGDLFEFVPEKGRLSWDGGEDYGEGGYTDIAGDVYSIEAVRTYDDEEAIAFSHGVCNSLSMSASARSPLKITADYKFKTAGTLGTVEAWEDNDLSDNRPFEGFVGTFLVDGNSIPIESIKVDCKNNMLEKMIIGQETRDSFKMGAFEVEGEFTLDFPDDGLDYLTSALQKTGGSIIGTFYHESNDYMAIDMPYVVYKPQDTKLNSIRQATIPFEAFENGGNYPIKVSVRVPPSPDDMFQFDAGTVARTLSEYFQFDAGTVSRTLSEYIQYDRDA